MRAFRDDLLEISVSDTGVGIPKAEQESVFDKFYQTGMTTKGVREGTGLGLAITRRLVEEHGGTIQARKRAWEGKPLYLHDSARTLRRRTGA